MMDEQCRLCPRRCGADRKAGARGWCGATDKLDVAAVCLHRGEEPPLNPIVNLFFAHCNLQCIYCQNHQISGQQSAASSQPADTNTIVDRIVSCYTSNPPTLQPSNLLLGFVTAAHYADRLPAIVEELHRRGLSPTVVYNSGGYESVETLRSLEGIVDVYLPDIKYMDSALAAAYSHAADYPQVAAAAIKEMKRQVGGSLLTDPDSHQALRGIIVRHLVLPGAVDNSKRCLDWLADNFTPWTLHLSLMAQYYPPREGLPAPLDRRITAEEYDQVCRYAEELGFSQGWTQALEATDNYRPDFTHPDNPFEK